MNQSRGVFEIPMEASLLIRMVWEIGSNAALKSSRMRMVSSPELAVIWRSLLILSRAVSVLCSSRLEPHVKRYLCYDYYLGILTVNIFSSPNLEG